MGDIHCLFSAFCILNFSFSCGVSLGWGRGKRGRRGGGCPGVPTTHLIEKPGTFRGMWGKDRLWTPAMKVWRPRDRWSPGEQ